MTVIMETGNEPNPSNQPRLLDSTLTHQWANRENLRFRPKFKQTGEIGGTNAIADDSFELANYSRVLNEEMRSQNL